jgi:hypothetical protein
LIVTIAKLLVLRLLKNYAADEDNSTISGRQHHVSQNIYETTIEHLIMYLLSSFWRGSNFENGKKSRGD